ncbi:MAG: hypothetical protein DLM56_09825 [Pseudonocardiales bacterium]|nr:MAG: hypothetical protein DLM56_09825 [Pseudonocardiales bacterium]
MRSVARWVGGHDRSERPISRRAWRIRSPNQPGGAGRSPRAQPVGHGRSTILCALPVCRRRRASRCELLTCHDGRAT